MQGALILLLVALALLVWAGLLMRGGAARALQDRVRHHGEPALAAARKAPPPLNIRAAHKDETGFASRLARMLRYNREVPQVLPAPVVAVIALLLGVLGGWRGVAYLGLPLGLPVGLGCAWFAARAVFGWQARRYSEQVYHQIPDALNFVLRAVRAGLPVSEALRGLTREMPEPTRSEFARVVRETAIGRPVDQALWHFYQRTGLTEYAFFAVTLGLQSQTGGSLAETLENLSDLVRKRVAMAARAHALAAEGRMSAMILIALPFVAGLGLTAMNPGYMDVFFNTPAGTRLLMTALTLLGLGILTIRYLIRQATAVT